LANAETASVKPTIAANAKLAIPILVINAAVEPLIAKVFVIHPAVSIANLD
jgi:hypothetical protein